VFRLFFRRAWLHRYVSPELGRKRRRSSAA
jgi:hypothetical protein